MVHGTKFEVDSRYTIIEPMGQGAYGVVCAATDEVGGQHVAVKKIESAFEHITFTKRTLRELRILRHMKHENVIDISSIFIPGDRKGFEDIYVISELMETDLTSILKSSQALTDDHCQFFLYQILRGMKDVHSAGVIHRDLKPRNLLVNSNCDLKICDFGLARVNFDDPDWSSGAMTEYVCTRWYRAPEVLCCWSRYERCIDVWSIGCIFAEMLGRKPIFPGNHTQHQLQLIVEALGSPTKEELQSISNEKCRVFLQSLPNGAGQPLSEKYSGANPVALTLLAEMLKFSGPPRCTVDFALRHEYLCTLSCPTDEPVREALESRLFEFERRRITLDALRDELYLEMLSYYPDLEAQYKAQHNFRDITSYRVLEPGETQYSDDEKEK
jgi:mitogen-activated protein kinase 1/3/mitogen-activated protein kinase 6